MLTTNTNITKDTTSFANPTTAPKGERGVAG